MGSAHVARFISENEGHVHSVARCPGRDFLTQVVMFTVAGTTLIGCGGARQVQRVYHMTDSQWVSVQSALKAHPGWRLAVDSDSRSPAAIQELRKSSPSFEAYFAVRSAQTPNPDFAVALRRDGQFKVLYFRADGSGYKAPQDVATVDWLNDGLIRLQGDTLHIAPLQSDEIFEFVWNPATKRLELLPDSAGDTVKQSSQERPCPGTTGVT